MSNVQRMSKAAILAMIDAPDPSLFSMTANLAIMTDALACSATPEEVEEATTVCAGDDIVSHVSGLRDARDLLVTIGASIATRGDGVTTEKCDQALGLLPALAKALDAQDVATTADDTLRDDLMAACNKAGVSSVFSTPLVFRGKKRRKSAGSPEQDERNKERARVRRAQLKAAQERIDDGTFPDTKANELIRKDGPLTKLSPEEIAAYKAPKAAKAPAAKKVAKG